MFFRRSLSKFKETWQQPMQETSLQFLQPMQEMVLQFLQPMQKTSLQLNAV